MSGRRSLQVKAVLLKEGVEEGLKEIRRFRLDEGEAGEERSGAGPSGVRQGVMMMASLMTSVHAVFNLDPTSQRCTLFWKDGDDDFIQFSTEEELTHALEVMHDDTFRVYITVSEGDMEDATEPMSERHVTFDVTVPQHANACQGGRKAWKAAHNMDRRAEVAKNKEFQKVRQQVPETFRRWVRQYVRLWCNQGPDAALQAPSSKGDTLPEGVPPHFPHWLHSFLGRHLPSSPTPGDTERMEGVLVEGVEETGEDEGPEGLPPVYFRWLCLFLPRFRPVRRLTSGDSEGEESRDTQGEGQKRRGHGGQGKHGCQGKRGGKHGARGTSSESEESDGGQKAWKQVPKEFRQYARLTVVQLHKNKGDNSDNKEKATRAGLSAEVQEFVEQILLEWHAKLTNQRPWVVAMEMMAGERTLPAGMEWEHFQWFCRFLLRWHRRHAGKCDVMSGWSSGDTATDNTSGEETTPACQVIDHGPWPRHRRELRAMMKMVRGRHPHGMMGHPPPPPPFAMHAGPPGHFHCPLPARCVGAPPRGGGKRCGRMGACWAQQDGGKRWKEQGGAGQGEASQGVQDDAVSHVTDGVKKI